MGKGLNLTNEQKTLFLTLCGKAMDYRSKNSILNDKWANEIVQKAGLDLKKYSDSKNRIVAVRAKQLDNWTNRFLQQNPKSVVINLGCGLDTRIARIQPNENILWFDVDFPDVIDLRKQFFDEKSNYKMLPSSVKEDGWLATIPKKFPVLILAEGLFSYLSKEEVKTLLNRLTDHFPKGEITFNVISKLALEKGIKTVGTIQKFTVEKLEELDDLNPNLKRIEEISLFESIYIQKLPFLKRKLLKMAKKSPKYRNMIRLLRYEF